FSRDWSSDVCSSDLLDDLVLAGVHLRHVDRRRRAADVDAPFRRFLRELQRVRVLEQCLRRDAAPVQARAAKRRLLLDDGDLEPELRGADGRDVSAGARSYDDQVVISHNMRWY